MINMCICRWRSAKQAGLTQQHGLVCSRRETVAIIGDISHPGHKQTHLESQLTLASSLAPRSPSSPHNSYSIAVDRSSGSREDGRPDSVIYESEYLGLNTDD